MPPQSSRAFAFAAGVLALLFSAGCAGHGAYTAEFKEQAQRRMAQVKAATQFDLATQQFLAGDLEKALKSVDQSIALNEKVAASRLLRGRILIEMGRLESALASLDAALALDPQNPDAHYYRGIVFERFNEYERALECYRSACAADPSNPQYLVAAAESLIDLGRLEDAQSLLTERETAFRHNAGVRQTLGHLAVLCGRPADAERFFGEARLLAPDDPSVLEDHARVLASLERFAEAEPLLRRLRARPDRADRHDLALLHARALLAVDRPVEARTILTRLASVPETASDSRVWAALADAAVLLRDPFQLRRCAHRLIALAPNSPDGFTYLAKWQLDAGMPEEALRSLARALELAPAATGRGDPTPALMQGLILSDLGRIDDARLAFEEALRRDPANPEARALLRGLPSSRNGPALAGAKEQEQETPQ